MNLATWIVIVSSRPCVNLLPERIGALTSLYPCRWRPRLSGYLYGTTRASEGAAGSGHTWMTPHIRAFQVPVWRL